MSTLPLVILGAGRQGKNAIEIARALGRPVRGFLDDTLPIGATVKRAAILGGFSAAIDPMDSSIFVAVGHGATRERVAASLARRGVPAACSLVHPTAVIEGDAPAGAYIAAFVHVRGDIRLSVGVLLESGTVLGRDVVFEPFASTGPHVAVLPGSVIGARAFLGAGARVVNGASVGPDAVVGAGALVVSDVPAGAFVVGVPARPATRRGAHFPPLSDPTG